MSVNDKKKKFLTKTLYFSISCRQKIFERERKGEKVTEILRKAVDEFCHKLILFSFTNHFASVSTTT